MANILVRDLPADVHKELLRRAQQNGQSLQQYLTVELGRLTARPTVEELFDRVTRRRGGRVGFATAVGDLEDERAIR